MLAKILCRLGLHDWAPYGASKGNVVLVKCRRQCGISRWGVPGH